MTPRERAHAFLRNVDNLNLCFTEVLLPRGTHSNLCDALTAEFEVVAEASPCAMCAARQEREAAAHARGRREALEEAAADFNRLHREGCEIVEEGRDRARPEEEIESDALRAEVWRDAADILSALAREEGKK